MRDSQLLLMVLAVLVAVCSAASLISSKANPRDESMSEDVPLVIPEDSSYNFIPGAPIPVDYLEEEMNGKEKRFDPYQKRFDYYKRFDPFQKRFDPYAKRFDGYYKRFDGYMKRFEP